MANGSRRRRRRVQANRKALGDRSDHRQWREHRELDVVPPSFLRLVTGERPAEQPALVNDLDAARWTTAEALWKLDTGRPATAAVHMAKAVSSESYVEACNAAHEVHAGQGSLIEYGLAAHTQMSRTLFAHLGDPRWHKRRMADALEW